jgi:hypothetical protein
MKLTTKCLMAFVLGLSLILSAQPEPSAITSPTPAPPPDAPENPGVADSDDQTPNPPPTLGEFLRPGAAGAGVAGTPNRETIGAVSTLCFKEPDPKALSETTEDVAVLSLLLSRNLEHAFAADGADYKLGIPMLLTGKQPVGASYIQGFGAILKIQVRFPVVPPPDGAEEAQTEKNGSEWEQARRELLTDENDETAYLGPHSEGYSAPKREGHGYEAKLVETLKKRVLALLRNASNLRHVEGDEWIIVKIVGTPNPAKQIRRVATRNDQVSDPSTSPKANKPNAPTEIGGPDDGAAANAVPGKKSRKHSGSNVRTATAVAETAQASSRSTIMTLRVKKSATDAFAAGTLSQEEFIKHAEVAAYLNPLPPNPRLASFTDIQNY